MALPTYAKHFLASSQAYIILFSLNNHIFKLWQHELKRKKECMFNIIPKDMMTIGIKQGKSQWFEKDGQLKGNS